MAHSNSLSIETSIFNGFVGRIPIYDRELELFAYDLKICSGQDAPQNCQSTPIDDAAALFRASEAIVLPDLLTGNPGFLTVHPAILGYVDDLHWPPEQLVLSVGAGSVLESRQSELENLSKRGYRFAIDDECQALETTRANGLVSICSLDAGQAQQASKTLIERFQDKGIRLYARNVGSLDQFERLQDLGFDLFHGTYFERPKFVKDSFIAANKFAVLELLAELQDPKVTIKEVEALVSKDMTLSYKILRLINTAYYGMPKRVDSISRAVVFFGLQRIKNWASTIVFNAVDYKPKALLATALVRARTCENLAQQLGRNATESYFIAGLFSILDAIMDVPMPKILEQLKLADDICDALLEGAGPIGELLTAVTAMEHGDYHPSAMPIVDQGLAMPAYSEAIAWSTAVTRAIAE